MPKAFLNKKLHRIIGQVKFRPTIISFDNTASLAADIEKQFEEWAAPKHDDIALYSPTEKKFLQINFDTITYLNEGKEDTKELHEYISKIFNKGIKELGINKIRRIGFRYVQVFECAFEFNELVELIYKKFYSQNEEVKNISIGNPRDTVFVLDGEKNGLLNHIQIGPVHKKEAIKTFNTSFPDSNTEIKESNLFIDVDVFVNEGLNQNNSMEKLQKAIDENLKITNAYLTYLQKP